MIATALVLATLGIADLARRRFVGARGTAAGIMFGTAVAIVAAIGFGLPWTLSVALVGTLLAWLALTAPLSKPHVGYWPITLLAAVTLGPAAFLSLEPAAGSPVARWYVTAPLSITESVGLVKFTLAIGIIVFLFESANVIVRIVLPTQPQPPTPEALAALDRAEGRSSSRRRWFSASRPQAAPPPTAPAATPLKGGRMIGPLERLFILALAVAGQFTAIAAVIAAKGIIRFPEISRDDNEGSKAEYFLIGSFASWGLVLFAAVLLALSP